LKEKRGLGDCPQGFDFVFEFKQKASLPMGVWGRSPQGFGSCLKGIMNMMLFRQKNKIKTLGLRP